MDYPASPSPRERRRSWRQGGDPSRRWPVGDFLVITFAICGFIVLIGAAVMAR